ncbi:MAG: UV DNA damage repair endonuclease UvsE [Dehalococcoidia bacterium]
MKIGYPCINRTIGCKADRTFRLKSYSESRLIETVQNNLDCLLKILQHNVNHNILFFRITSDLVPFASHPINTFDWIKYFNDRFKEIGEFIRSNDIRVSMHPDQFNVINAKDAGVFQRTVRELEYHAFVLDAMGLDTTAKIQIHVGGVYGDKAESTKRFVKQYIELPGKVRNRLVIENDDRLYTVSDCIDISGRTGIPVLFDNLHHLVNCSGESVLEAIREASSTWPVSHGLPMVDYSSQEAGERKGNHAESIDLEDFKSFLQQTAGYDFDIMLEIKDKERSALKAVEIARIDERLDVI